MKEPYGKGLAPRPGPESCASHGNMTGVALTGVRAGQPLSSESILSACRPCRNALAGQRTTPVAEHRTEPRGRSGRL